MKALIIVDVLYDFLPGGALGIPESDKIIPIINHLMPQFDLVISIQDWHPPNHCSFAKTHGKKIGEVITIQGTQQILWPVHCVQETHGAELHADLNQKKIDKLFYKGTDPFIDSYSAFFDNAKLRSTDLENYLKKNGIKEIYFVGLTTDYCVKYSALDGIVLGFEVFVITNACKAINRKKNDEKEALQCIEQAGGHIIQMN